jgi:PAS domain S-box-containing protein
MTQIDRTAASMYELFGQLAESVAAYDLGGLILYVNPATERLFARPGQELIGRSIWEIFPDAVGNPFHQVFRRVAGTGQAEQFEHYYPPFERWFSNAMYRVGDVVWVIARDVTKRYAAEARQKEANARLAVLAEVSRTFAQAGHDLKRTLDGVARRLAELLGDMCLIRMVSDDGRTLDRVLGFHDSDPERAAAFIAMPPQSVTEGLSGRALATRSPLMVNDAGAGAALSGPPTALIVDGWPAAGTGPRMVVPILVEGRSAGLLSMLRGVGRPGYSEDDLTLLQDVADRAALAIRNALSYEQAEKARKEVLSITDALPALVGFVGKDGLYRFVSRTYEDWLGVPRESFIGRHVADTLDADARALVRPHVDRALAGEEVSFEMDAHLPGRLGTFRVTYSPMRNEAGELDGFVGLAFDVTEHHEAVRRKDEFLALLGHELRNPLAPILTALELMRLRGDDSARREREVIERQARHMVQLVDDLLDTSRVTRGQLKLRMEPVEVADAMDRAIEMASPLFEQRHHRLAVDVPRRGALVHGDPTRLSQVFANLLTNAAKYTEPGGSITVVAQRVGEHVRIRVKDNGIGIPPELQQDIFAPFTQVSRLLDRAPGGLGLGLPLVKSLVHLHGGSVSVFSEGPGCGSELTVELPAASPAALPAPAAAPAMPRRTKAARKILVVDDNQDAAESLVELLGELGHEVIMAHDGPSALAAAAELAPDIAILDIGLPVMDGYELARRLIETLAKKPRLIAITGYGQASDRLRSREAGFDVHLVKPVTMEALLQSFEAGPPSAPRSGASRA